VSGVRIFKQECMLVYMLVCSIGKMQASVVVAVFMQTTVAYHMYDTFLT
jgi:hypothetical protein